MASLCDDVQKIGKGISSGPRYRILESLANGSKTVSELTVIAKVSQPAVSQHLATLKSAGLVVSEKRGQEVIYSINSHYIVSVLKKFVTHIKK